MTYTVYEAATLVGVNPETIRRWIRSGRLVASISSKKEGYIISEVDLQRMHSKDSAALRDIYKEEKLETQRMIRFHEAMLKHYKKHLKELEGR